MATDVVTLMNEIQEIYLSWPFFGYCRITAMLRGRGYGESQMCFTPDEFIGLAGFIPKKEFIREETRG